MATKRQLLKPNKTTRRFDRRIGWEWKGDKQKYTQPKFYLGKDLRKAELASRRLEQLWEFILAEHEKLEKKFGPRSHKPHWDSVTLQIAKAVSKGETTLVIERHQGEQPVDYARRIDRLSADYPVMKYLPEDAAEYQKGVETVNGWHQQKLEELNEQLYSSPFGNVQSAHVKNVMLKASGKSLFQAFDAYEAWVKKNSVAPPVEGEEQKPSQWGVFQCKVIARLKRHHKDQPIEAFDFNGVEEMLTYWRNRPMVMGTQKPIAAKTAKHTLWQIKDFFNWLHRNSDFDWRKPDGIEDIKVTIARTPDEIASKAKPKQTYNIEELCLLYRYATPIERMLLLLGLNCGFGAAESGTLKLDEIYLRQEHPYHQYVLGYDFGKSSSIRRVRGKNGVYGEWKLWPATVDAMEWAMAALSKPEVSKFLMMTENGKTFYEQTVSGNRNQRIPNKWDALVKRVQKDHADFRKLSFGKLRKTGASLIRQFSNGEVSGVFLTHGHPVKSDELADLYTDRPFGKVFEAIDAVEKYLQPMFNSCVPEWPVERKKGGPNLTPGQIDSILSLHKQGNTPREISEQVGVSVATVYRRIQHIDKS